MTARRKRSISMPPEPCDQIRDDASRSGLTYSAWMAIAAHNELVIRDGLRAVSEVEAELGAFTERELEDAEEWAEGVIGRNQR